MSIEFFHHRRPKARLWIAAILVLTSVAARADGVQPPGRQPNFIIIFIDDMGYADIGPFGAPPEDYSTPQIDRMAREGRVFTDFYVTQAVCSASRAGLLTGCYNLRIGILGALNHRAEHGIHADEVTLAEIVRQKGYATACFGKWHLGHHPKFLPIHHGFDHYFGLPYSNDMWPGHPTAGRNFPPLPLIEQDRVVDGDVSSQDQSQLTTWYTERAVRFIEENRDRPFLLYLAHTMVHVPLYVSGKFLGATPRGLFGDAVSEIDWSVGQVLDTIRTLGLGQNTFVLFTSDNGPWLSYGDHAGSAGPLREGKGTMFDGGCRVPTIAWWPGTIPAGTSCRRPAMTIDLLPTIAARIGASLPEHTIDGKDIWPLLVAEPGAESPHEAYFFYYGDQLQAVRMGRWKLHFPHEYPTLSGRPGGTGGQPAAQDRARIDRALFDLEEDIGETFNVADRFPEVVARIEALAERMRDELGDSLVGRSGRSLRRPGRLQEGDARLSYGPNGQPAATTPAISPD
jgi:arylsulfatase A-like enzyme